MCNLDQKIEQENLSKLIHAIEVVLKEKGIKATQDQLSNESSIYLSSKLGTGELFNVIPSNPTLVGVCCKLAIAIAYGSQGIGGLCQVFQQLRSHLIYCADARKGMSTKTVLIIYDKEDYRIFWESKRDLQAHRQHNGINFIRLFWDGMRLIERKF